MQTNFGGGDDNFFAVSFSIAPSLLFYIFIKIDTIVKV